MARSTFKTRFQHLVTAVCEARGIDAPKVTKGDKGRYVATLPGTEEGQQAASIIVALARHQRAASGWKTKYSSHSYDRSTRVTASPATSVWNTGRDKCGYWSGPTKASEALTEVEDINYTALGDISEYSHGDLQLFNCQGFSRDVARAVTALAGLKGAQG